MEDETPWDYLGLDEETATKKDAKRAYARLLKENRPEENPDEFQKLREAYELVNQWIDQREWYREFEENNELAPTTEEPETDSKIVEFSTPEAGEPVATTEEDPLTATAIPYTPFEIPELEEIFQRLQKTASLTAEDRFNSIFKEGTRFTHDFPECLDDWGNRVASLCAERPERIARNFKRSDVVYELENDCRIQSDCLLRHLLAQGDYYELGVLANHLREDGKRLTNPVSASFLTDLADAIGFVQPNRGTGLLDQAYPNLPPGLRDYEVNRVEYRVNRGKMFSGAFAEKRREFWDARIRESEEGQEYDWWCDEAREEVSSLNGAMLTQPILNELESLLPEEIFERISKSKTTDSPTKSSIDSSGLFGSCLFIFVALVALISLGKCVLDYDPITNSKRPEYKSLDYSNLQSPIIEFPGLQLNFEVPQEFCKLTPVLGAQGLVKMESIFFPEALRTPTKGVQPGSKKHLLALEKATEVDLIPLEHRLTIPEIITEVAEEEAAVEILNRILEKSIDSDIIYKAKKLLGK